MKGGIVYVAAVISLIFVFLPQRREHVYAEPVSGGQWVRGYETKGGIPSLTTYRYKLVDQDENSGDVVVANLGYYKNWLITVFKVDGTTGIPKWNNIVSLPDWLQNSYMTPVDLIVDRNGNINLFASVDTSSLFSIILRAILYVQLDSQGNHIFSRVILDTSKPWSTGNLTGVTISDRDGSVYLLATGITGARILRLDQSQGFKISQYALINSSGGMFSPSDILQIAPGEFTITGVYWPNFGAQHKLLVVRASMTGKSFRINYANEFSIPTSGVHSIKWAGIRVHQSGYYYISAADFYDVVNNRSSTVLMALDANLIPIKTIVITNGSNNGLIPQDIETTSSGITHITCLPLYSTYTNAIVSFDPLGNLLAAKSYGKASSLYSMSIDSSDNIYTVGSTSIPGYKLLLAKLNQNANIPNSNFVRDITGFIQTAEVFLGTRDITSLLNASAQHNLVFTDASKILIIGKNLVGIDVTNIVN